jgi:acyl carrier protein
MNPAKPTPEQVRSFILNLYAGKLGGRNAADIPDDFDLLAQSVIDSMGVIELVGELERQYGFELDMSGMDTDLLTRVGPLAKFVSAQIAGGGAPPEA